MYDCVIIGLGPAGISAALTAKKRGLNFLLIGKKAENNKMALAPHVQNYPGLGNVTGKELSAAFYNHLDSENIKPVDIQIQTVYAFGDTFYIANSGDPIEARKVILCVGSETKKPIKGEKELLGKGVSYCATCDGTLYKGKTVAVLMDANEPEEAAFVSSLAAKTYLATRHDASKIPNITKMDTYATEIIGTDKVEAVQWANGETTPVDGVFVLKASFSPDVLVPGIKSEKGAIVVDRSMETNIKGLFAAGDCTGEPFQYAKAVGEGCVAAISAAKEITAENLAKAA